MNPLQDRPPTGAWGVFQKERSQPAPHLKYIALNMMGWSEENNGMVVSLKSYVVENGTMRPGGFLMSIHNNERVRISNITVNVFMLLTMDRTRFSKESWVYIASKVPAL